MHKILSEKKYLYTFWSFDGCMCPPKFHPRGPGGTEVVVAHLARHLNVHSEDVLGSAGVEGRMVNLVILSLVRFWTIRPPASAAAFSTLWLTFSCNQKYDN